MQHILYYKQKADAQVIQRIIAVACPGIYKGGREGGAGGRKYLKSFFLRLNFSTGGRPSSENSKKKRYFRPKQ